MADLPIIRLGAVNTGILNGSEPFGLDQAFPITSPTAFIVGHTYVIDAYVSGDDFSNIATVFSGTINTDGCIFVATGTTPTTWTNGSAIGHYVTVKMTLAEWITIIQSSISAGATITTGTGNPSGGNDGDFYIQRDASASAPPYIFWLKISGTWTPMPNTVVSEVDPITAGAVAGRGRLWVQTTAAGDGTILSFWVADNAGNWDETPLSGSSYTVPQDTWINWDAQRQAGTLPIARDILVTAQVDPHLGIRLKTNRTGDGFETLGVGGFLNMDFGEYGNDISANPRYAGIQAVTGVAPLFNRAQWMTNLEGGYSRGDIVFWNTEHYQVIDDTQFDGTDPSVNAVAYSAPLDRNTPNMGYEPAWDEIHYYFETNNIYSRIDTYGNYIVGAGNIQRFPWGRYEYHIDFASASGFLDVRNNLYPLGITGRAFGENVQIYINNMASFVVLDVSGDDNTITSNIGSSGLLDINIRGKSTSITTNNIQGNITLKTIGDSITVVGNGNTSTGVVNVEIHHDASFDFTNNAGEIVGVIENGDYTISLNSGEVLPKFECSNSGTFVFPANKSFPAGRKLTQTGSTFTATVDITGLTTVDLLALTTNKYAGIFYLTSTNATETINKIANGNTLFGYAIVPVQITGILNQITVQSTLRATAIGAPSNQILLENNADIDLYFGDDNTGDYLELTTGSLGLNRQTGGSIL